MKLTDAQLSRLLSQATPLDDAELNAEGLLVSLVESFPGLWGGDTGTNGPDLVDALCAALQGLNPDTKRALQEAYARATEEAT